MRTGAASARRHNENDVTMTIAGLWRYGDRRHVATGCNAVVTTEVRTVLRMFAGDLALFEYDDERSLCCGNRTVVLTVAKFIVIQAFLFLVFVFTTRRYTERRIWHENCPVVRQTRRINNQI